ncbi:hypothetical protein AB834_05110 [PVC group bacterium (ex Bugula neritina AB1)]|nr:hypothetical protein AB834_05110 [PVC group bacterium (ex Bugula neritina AB1)]
MPSLKNFFNNKRYVLAFIFLISFASISHNIYQKKQKRELAQLVATPLGDFEVLHSKNINLTGALYGINNSLEISDLQPVFFHKGLHIEDYYYSAYSRQRSFNMPYWDISNQRTLIPTYDHLIAFDSRNTELGYQVKIQKNYNILMFTSKNDIYIITEDPNRPLFPAGHYPPSVPSGLLVPSKPCNNSYVIVNNFNDFYKY